MFCLKNLLHKFYAFIFLFPLLPVFRINFFPAHVRFTSCSVNLIPDYFSLIVLTFAPLNTAQAIFSELLRKVEQTLDPCTCVEF
jgi:hypothetical protein